MTHRLRTTDLIIIIKGGWFHSIIAKIIKLIKFCIVPCILSVTILFKMLKKNAKILIQLLFAQL